MVSITRERGYQAGQWVVVGWMLWSCDPQSHALGPEGFEGQYQAVCYNKDT